MMLLSCAHGLLESARLMLLSRMDYHIALLMVYHMTHNTARMKRATDFFKENETLNESYASYS